MLYITHFASFIFGVALFFQCFYIFIIILVVLRKELRPGVLWFLRDPNDPSFEPIRDMLVIPLHQYARRFVFSLVLYATTIGGLVFMPLKANRFLLSYIYARRPLEFVFIIFSR
jgi:E3 ubiquitin-protein ligase DOA10